MLASASPRKPSVRSRSRSSKARSLDVAWRPKAATASRGPMPQPSSVTWIRSDPARRSTTSTCAGAGVERVLHHLLERRGGPLHDLAGRDLGRQRVGQRPHEVVAAAQSRASSASSPGRSVSESRTGLGACPGRDPGSASGAGVGRGGTGRGEAWKPAGARPTCNVPGLREATGRPGAIVAHRAVSCRHVRAPAPPSPRPTPTPTPSAKPVSAVRPSDRRPSRSAGPRPTAGRLGPPTPIAAPSVRDDDRER